MALNRRRYSERENQRMTDSLYFIVLISNLHRLENPMLAWTTIKWIIASEEMKARERIDYEI